MRLQVKRLRPVRMKTGEAEICICPRSQQRNSVYTCMYELNAQQQHCVKRDASSAIRYKTLNVADLTHTLTT